MRWGYLPPAEIRRKALLLGDQAAELGFHLVQAA